MIDCKNAETKSLDLIKSIMEAINPAATGEITHVQWEFKKGNIFLLLRQRWGIFQCFLGQNFENQMNNHKPSTISTQNCKDCWQSFVTKISSLMEAKFRSSAVNCILWILSRVVDGFGNLKWMMSSRLEFKYDYLVRACQ